MNTLLEVENAQSEAQSIISNMDFLNAASPELNENFFESAKKYIEFAAQIIFILAKYFIKNGKISIPSLVFFWKYFGLVSELYKLFTEFKTDTK